MILLAIRDYVQQKQCVDLKEIARHFQCDSDVMRDMLSHWLRKGMIKRSEKSVHCGVRCVECQPNQNEVYVWHECDTDQSAGVPA